TTNSAAWAGTARPHGAGQKVAFAFEATVARGDTLNLAGARRLQPIVRCADNPRRADGFVLKCKLAAAAFRRAGKESLTVSRGQFATPTGPRARGGSLDAYTSPTIMFRISV